MQNRAGAPTQAAVVLLVAALTGCATPRDRGYFLTHSTEREEKVSFCDELASRHINTTGDPQCAAAYEADAQAIRAEHGPPFHNHDARWYRFHSVQQLLEAAYCEDPRNQPTSDPDCDAASKGALPSF